MPKPTNELKSIPIITDNSMLNAEKENVSNQISRAGNEMMAAMRLERLNNEEGLVSGMTDLSGLSREAQRLFSNYKIDENGNYVLSDDGQRQLKTLKQKIIDTYYIAQNYNELGIKQGEVKDNKGDKQNKETDTTVRGAIKSVEKDIQRNLGVEDFKFEEYLSDYSDWADNYAQLRQNYDSTYNTLQEKQVI